MIEQGGKIQSISGDGHYDDGGAHDGALAVSAEDCACITHAAAEGRQAV